MKYRASNTRVFNSVTHLAVGPVAAVATPTGGAGGRGMAPEASAVVLPRVPLDLDTGRVVEAGVGQRDHAGQLMENARTGLHGGYAGAGLRESTQGRGYAAGLSRDGVVTGCAVA